MNAQTIDPKNFFPSSVGNIWQYSGIWGATEHLFKDSVDNEGFRHLFYTYDGFFPDYATYKLDTLNQVVYYTPFQLSWYYYKLNCDSGAIWIVDSLDLGIGMTYKLALCRNQYNGQIFGVNTTFKEITFYDYQSDTIITQQSWPRYTFILAYGIGEISQFDEEGGGPVRVLQGCIINGDTLGIITSIDQNLTSLDKFILHQNYPNPFNPNTTISFSIPETDFVQLKVFDMLGEEVVTLVNESKSPGNYSVHFNAADLPSGIYIYSLRVNGQVQNRKMLLIK